VPDVQLQAGTIRYQDTGGSGPVVVLLHGLAMDGSLWRHVVHPLRDEYRCVVPTLPLGGHRRPMRADADLSPRGISPAPGRVPGRPGPARGDPGRQRLGPVPAHRRPAPPAHRAAGHLLLRGVRQLPPGLPSRTVALAGRLPGGLSALVQPSRRQPLRCPPPALGWMAKRPIPMRSPTPGRRRCWASRRSARPGQLPAGRLHRPRRDSGGDLGVARLRPVGAGGLGGRGPRHASSMGGGWPRCSPASGCWRSPAATPSSPRSSPRGWPLPSASSSGRPPRRAHDPRGDRAYPDAPGAVLPASCVGRSRSTPDRRHAMGSVTPAVPGTEAAQAWVFAFAEGWWAPTSPEAFADHFEPWLHPHVRLIQPGMPMVVGRRAFRERFARPLFALIPDLPGQVERPGGGADCRYLELALRGTPGGRPVAWRPCDRATLRDGVVVERESYFDPTPLLRAILTRPRAWPVLARTRTRQLPRPPRGSRWARHRRHWPTQPQQPYTGGSSEEDDS